VRIHKALLVTVAAAVAALGIASRSHAATNGAPVFAGVDLADAVLFNEGPAAPYLAGFPRSTNVWTDSARRHRAGVDAAITADPHWAASFAYRLQGGDLGSVDAALLDLAKLARTEADRLFGPAEVNRAVERASRTDGLYVLQPPYQEMTLDIVLHQADVVVTVYILVSSLTAQPGPNGQLLHERLVYEVATNLRTTG
jgi:hypothetical protein